MYKFFLNLKKPAKYYHLPTRRVENRRNWVHWSGLASESSETWRSCPFWRNFGRLQKIKQQQRSIWTARARRARWAQTSASSKCSRLVSKNQWDSKHQRGKKWLLFWRVQSFSLELFSWFVFRRKSKVLRFFVGKWISWNSFSLELSGFSLEKKLFFVGSQNWFPTKNHFTWVEF